VVVRGRMPRRMVEVMARGGSDVVAGGGQDRVATLTLSI
jgi:hypothetical protein